MTTAGVGPFEPGMSRDAATIAARDLGIGLADDQYSPCSLISDPPAKWQVIVDDKVRRAWAQRGGPGIDLNVGDSADAIAVKHPDATNNGWSYQVDLAGPNTLLISVSQGSITSLMLQLDDARREECLP